MEGLMARKYFEDCAIGEEVTSPGRTITETDIVQFAYMTGDWMPMHTDEVYAQESAFGERIAHGMLILVAGSALLLRGGSQGVLPEATLALYSVDKVRFIGPTRIGDTIHTRGEVTKMQELDAERGLVTLLGSIENQRGEEVMRFTVRAVVARAPAES
jgi:acyl dehydratase